MNHGLPEESVAAIQRVLATFPEVEKAVLYGSRAKGNFKRGSDIDLTLFGDGLDDRMMARIDWALDDLLLPQKIDLSLFSQLQHPALMDHIRRVGLPLSMNDRRWERYERSREYHNSIADAVADLGRPEEIGKAFAGFQQYLYKQG